MQPKNRHRPNVKVVLTDDNRQPLKNKPLNEFARKPDTVDLK